MFNDSFKVSGINDAAFFHENFANNLIGPVFNFDIAFHVEQIVSIKP